MALTLLLDALLPDRYPSPPLSPTRPRCLFGLVLLGAVVVAPAAAQTPASMAPEARSYVETALDTMQTHSMMRDSVDWAELREEVLRRAESAEKPSDTYPALQYALDRLDKHSFLMGAEQAAQWKANQDADSTDASAANGEDAGPPPRGWLLEGGDGTPSVGYVRVPPISTGSEAVMTTRADSLQTVVAKVDAHAPCGWVVDLRGNTGGNMWPMLAGIGPVLGEGHAGTVMRVGQPDTPWAYEDGKAIGNDTVRVEVTGEPYRLSEPNPPVAVLAGDSTTSSGEAMLVSFQGRPNTRTFGTRTHGYTTANQTFDLPDGALMLLAVGPLADRTGTAYSGGIRPDVTVQRPDSVAAMAEDPAVQAARSWLAKQPACRP
jgi:C-terminal processing protease CtpA/Prc